MPQTKWEEIKKQLEELEEDAGDIGHHTIYHGVIRIERVDKFITNLRKSDEEALDKLISIKLQEIANTNLDARENSFNELVNFRRLLQTYYKSN